MSRKITGQQLANCQVPVEQKLETRFTNRFPTKSQFLIYREPTAQQSLN